MSLTVQRVVHLPDSGELHTRPAEIRWKSGGAVCAQQSPPGPGRVCSLPLCSFCNVTVGFDPDNTLSFQSQGTGQGLEQTGAALTPLMLDPTFPNTTSFSCFGLYVLHGIQEPLPADF